MLIKSSINIRNNGVNKKEHDGSVVAFLMKLWKSLEELKPGKGNQGSGGFEHENMSNFLYG